MRCIPVLSPLLWFVGGFFRTLKQTLLEQLGHVRVYGCPLWFVLNPAPFKVKARHIRRALDVLQPGDIIVRAYDTYLLSLFIPGRFSHSAVYVGKRTGYGDAELVIHALGTGVQRQDVIDFLMACDAFAILRPADKSGPPTFGGFHIGADGEFIRHGEDKPSVAEKACQIAESYVGTPYNYDLKVSVDYANKAEVQKRSKALYCHELTRSCYPELDIPLVQPVLWNGMLRSSRKQFLAQSFFDSPDFTVVYDSYFSHVQA